MIHKISNLLHHISQDFLGGPRPFKLSTLINIQKGGTLPFVILLMYYFDNFSLNGWIYAGLHGSYGICWLIKHINFPDKRWDVSITIGGAFVSFILVLGLYWVFPIILISPWFHPIQTNWSGVYLGACIFLHTIGVVIMMASDAQKYYTLKYHPGLIREGLFTKTRNPNYLGEMMIYASYALMARHWIAWVILAWVWIGYFAVNMINKDQSLSKKTGWIGYKKQTGILLPKVFSQYEE